MTIISIRLLHKGSIETAILFGFFTLLIGVTTLLYFLGKYQMLTSSDLTKLEKALQTLQKTVGNRFFFTESAIIILNDFSLCYYDCRKYLWLSSLFLNLPGNVLNLLFQKLFWFFMPISLSLFQLIFYHPALRRCSHCHPDNNMIIIISKMRQSCSRRSSWSNKILGVPAL